MNEDAIRTCSSTSIQHRWTGQAAIIEGPEEFRGDCLARIAEDVGLPLLQWPSPWERQTVRKG